MEQSNDNSLDIVEEIVDLAIITTMCCVCNIIAKIYEKYGNKCWPCIDKERRSILVENKKCANRKRGSCKIHNCMVCYDRSFYSHIKSLFWSEKNKTNPRDYSKHSDIKVYFDCKDCGHEIYMLISGVSNGKWCIYCNGNALCNNKDCRFCKNKSFASHERSVYWHKSLNGAVKPRDICKSTDTKYWFLCNNCAHEFYSALSNITSKN